LGDAHFIDGQALDLTSFGEFDTNGVWQPIDASGLTFGTNGFHLPFSNNSTAAALGTDTSSNGNTWTVNNISVTAGAGNDSLVDSPTNGSQVDTGVGGEVVGNYATWNPLDQKNSNTFSNGNLDCALAGAGEIFGTQGVSSGKWYFEIIGTATSDPLGRYAVNAGVANLALTQSSRYNAGSWAFYTYTGAKFSNGVETSYGNQAALNAVVGVAVDLDNSKIWFSAPSPTPPPVLNTGLHRPQALCTTNLPEPTIADGSTVMDVALYTGNGSTQTISGLNFSPDLVWLKAQGTLFW
jgi:hypothetical protein